MTVSVDLLGRLGNNLFQAAMAIGYAEKNNVEYRIPEWEYAGCFKTNFTSASAGSVFVGENGFAYQELPFIEDVKFFGYWQSEKYFKHCEAKIRELFRFSDDITYKVNCKYAPLIKSLENTCSIHVRRGDYIGNAFHEVCNLQYYKDAINEMKRRTNVELFVVFSDDIPWCRENLSGENFLFADGNSNIEDLYLQTQCTHNIICNSTFSWWGAWLGANKDKIVIAPDKWFNDPNWDTKDLLPDEWVKVKVQQ